MPEGVESYEEWKYSTLARLKTHFSVEAEAADLSQSFFSQSAEKGMVLFDLLARRYDVVAANPPYLGSGKMGQMLKTYTSKHYAPGKRDLYAAFILRNIQLANKGGRVAMVTQQSWMFLRSFAVFRALDEEKLTAAAGKGIFKGLLRETTIETLAHLGPRAFEEISGEVVSVALFCIVTSQDKNRSSYIFRGIDLSSPNAKAIALREMNTDRWFVIRQYDFLRVPFAPLAYWITKRLLDLLSGKLLSEIATTTRQIDTCNNNRFLRFLWEVPISYRWLPYLKAGGYSRWLGFDQMFLDWRTDGTTLKQSLIEKYNYLNGNTGWLVKESSFFKEGWTYSLMAQGAIGVRYLDGKHICDSASPCILPRESLWEIGAFLNTRLASFLLRTISTDLKFREGYIGRLPKPPILSETYITALKHCIILKSQQLKGDMLERLFHNQYQVGVSLRKAQSEFELLQMAGNAWQYTLEAIIESGVYKALRIDNKDRNIFINETGMPSGWFPLIQSYDSLITIQVDLPKTPSEILDYLEKNERRVLLQNELMNFKSRLHDLYKLGPGIKVEGILDETGEDDDEEDDSNIMIGACIPIPSETFLEELSVNLEIHPISIYLLLKEGIEKQGWRCLSEEKRFVEDKFTVMVLRLLGHRWPRQIEASEPIPDWADKDGIIPITECYGEKIMLERVRFRIPTEFPGGNVTSIEREFEEVVGMSLEKWLSGPFFEHHISQFKKRPIGWQIESKPGSISGKSRKRNSRADSGSVFSCLIYYHKLDSDLLPKIRTQYVGPLKTRYETELRVLEGTGNPTADQSARKVQLENWIEELKAFDSRLETVIRDGFDSDALKKIRDNEPLDRWTSREETTPQPTTKEEWYIEEKRYNPDLNDGVRVNITPLQKAGLLASDVLANKDLDKAISDRAEWRADERRWCRQGKLPKPGWWNSGACDHI